MFDIFESHEYRPPVFENMQMEISDIDNDISSDIDNLLANRFDSLYIKDVYKKRHIAVEIIYPRIQYNHHKVLLKSPDYFRFLLSLYPFTSDLENVEKIVVRPRHVVLGNVELMGLYLHRKEILVIYLHQPHFYSLKTSRFAQFAEFTPLTHILQAKVINTQNTEDNSYLIPPLWYMLSLIEASHSDKVDKFLLRCDTTTKLQAALDEISFFYGRHGY